MSQENNWSQQVWQQPGAPTGEGASQPFPQPQPLYSYPQPPQPKKSHGWIVAVVIILVLALLAVVGMVSCTSCVASLGSTANLSEADTVAQDAVGVITIEGTIQYDNTTSSPEGLKAQLDRAANNSHIKAVVLRVNSGGGVATAGEEMAEYVKEFSESTHKPVVVSSAATNASAAYEVSSQADYIYTAKTTAIGAIGTVMQTTDFSGLMEKLGINIDNIASAESKDSSYGSRPLTEDERAYYQAQVDQINESFIQTVAQGRNMSEEEVRTLATGLTFTGIQAVENGLADEVGTLEDAQKKAAELAGVSSYTAVSLKVNTSDWSSLLDLMSRSTSSNEVATALKELESDGTIVR